MIDVIVGCVAKRRGRDNDVIVGCVANMSGSRSTPSPLVQSSRTKLFRQALDTPSARAKLHREHLLLMKELERLQKQETIVVSHVDTNRHAIKMLQQQIERRQPETEASPIQRIPTGKKPSQRQTILQNQTVVAVPSSSEFGPRTSSHAGNRAEQGTEDEATHPQYEEPHATELVPPPSDPAYSSPYISSPLLYARRNVLPKPFKSPVSSLVASSSTSKPDADVRLPPVTLRARPGTATKSKLQRVDLTGLGLDTRSSGPESFRHFYSSGSQFASAVFDADNPEDEEEGHGVKPAAGEEREPQTLEELFEEIRRCRYIRIYQPRGSRHQPHAHQPSVSQAWQFDRMQSNSTIK